MSRKDCFVYAIALFLAMASNSTKLHAQEEKPTSAPNVAQPSLTIAEAARDQRKATELVRFTIAQSVESARALRSSGESTAADQMLSTTLDLISRLGRLPGIDAERMALAVKAELDPEHNQAPDASGYDEIHGHVLRSKDEHAEINLNRGHGLHNWQRGYVFRNGVFIDKFAIVLTDAQQAAGFSDNLKHLQPGDEVVFRRKRPAAGSHPANALIGKRAELSLNFMPSGEPSKYSLRVYEVEIDAFGGIVSVLVGDDTLMPNLHRYKSEYIDKMSTSTDSFVLDKPTGQLITPLELAQRNSWRNELLLAQRREAEAAAERQRVIAEIASRDREVRQQKADESKRRIAELAQLHLVPTNVEDVCVPAPGYDWVDPHSARTDVRVRWQPGKQHRKRLPLAA